MRLGIWGRVGIAGEEKQVQSCWKLPFVAEKQHRRIYTLPRQVFAFCCALSSNSYPDLLRKMAGGTSIWFSKDAKSDPTEIFNGRLLYLLITVAWAGCFYGFDSGNIGGILTLPSFEKAFGLDGLSQEQLDKRSVRETSHFPSLRLTF